jgi:transcriptional regulator with XRE-family HTH domain
MKLATDLPFGAFIKKLRISKNLKLTDLATQIGIDKGLLSKIESNERKATREQLENLASVLKVDFKILNSSWLATKIAFDLKYEAESYTILQTAEKLIGILQETNKSPEDIIQEIIILHEQYNQIYQKKTADLEKPLHPLKVKFTHHLAQSVGNNFSLQETTFVIEQGLTIGGKSLKEHLQVKSIFDTLTFIFKVAESKIPFNTYVLIEINHLLNKGIDHANAGDDLKIYQLNNANYLNEPSQFSHLFQYYETHKASLHPILLAANMFSKINSLEPSKEVFYLTGIMVMNVIALQNRYPLLLVSKAALQSEHSVDELAFQWKVLQASKSAFQDWIKALSSST